MRRVVAHEARLLHLAWAPERTAYEFRLMYGRRYLTPKLWLSPLEWYDLVEGTHGVDLGGWVGLAREGKLLHVRPLRVLDYGPGLAGVPKEWPPMYFPDFYDAATDERGKRPEEDWHAVYQARLDAQREQWGPA